MPFKVNGKTYAHADGKVTITPLEGPNQNNDFTLKTARSIKYAPNADSELLQGSSGAPVSIVPIEAEPDWEVELSALEESQDLAKHLGPGAARVLCDVSCTWWRVGLAATDIELPATYITTGLGAESDSGSAPSDTIGGKCTDVKINGVSVLRREEEQEA